MPDRRKLSDKVRERNRGRAKPAGSKTVKHPRLHAFFMSRAWQVYGAGGCLLAVAVLVLCAGLVMDGIWTGRLNDLEADLKMRVEIAEAEAKRNQEPAAGQANAGVISPGSGPVDYVGETNQPRRTEDDRVVMDMVKHATTWKNRAEYTEARRELLDSYDWLDMNTNAEFLSSFFPAPDDLYVKLDGVVVADNLADGRNITFESMMTYLLSEEPNGTRHYLAEIVVQSSGQVGGTSQAMLGATYTTRSDGSVWNLKCYSV